VNASRAAPSPPGGGPLQSDVWLYGAVVVALSIIASSTVVGTIALALVTNKDTPQLLIALGSASIGALAGVLAPFPRAR
jgi:hypothetical protein